MQRNYRKSTQKEKIPVGPSYGSGLTIGYGPSSGRYLREVADLLYPVASNAGVLHIDAPNVFEYVWLIERKKSSDGVGVSIGTSPIFQFNLVGGKLNGVGIGIMVSEIGITYYHESGFNTSTKADFGFTNFGIMGGGGVGFGYVF